MTPQQVLDLINQFIIQNGTNDITANVLRPILEDMVSQPNDYIGDITDLQTNDTSSLVNAINEILSAVGSDFTIHVGSTDPNITPPAQYSIGDFYEWQDGGLQGFYQFNGANWVKIQTSASGGGEVRIGNLWFYTAGNVDVNAIENGNEFRGFVTTDRYVTGIVLDATNFDIDDDTKAKIFTDIIH